MFSFFFETDVLLLSFFSPFSSCCELWAAYNTETGSSQRKLWQHGVPCLAGMSATARKLFVNTLTWILVGYESRQGMYAAFHVSFCLQQLKWAFYINFLFVLCAETTCTVQLVGAASNHQEKAVAPHNQSSHLLQWIAEQPLQCTHTDTHIETWKLQHKLFVTTN